MGISCGRGIEDVENEALILLTGGEWSEFTERNILHVVLALSPKLVKSQHSFDSLLLNTSCAVKCDVVVTVMCQSRPTVMCARLSVCHTGILCLNGI